MNDLCFSTGINGGHLWIGLSDLDEGQFRWSIDQELATNVNWVSWHKASDPGHNCVSMYYIGPSWLDWRCSSEFGYVCETDFCKFFLNKLRKKFK